MTIYRFFLILAAFWASVCATSAATFVEDFESSSGYTVGQSLGTYPGWSVYSGSALISNESAFSGFQSVKLLAANPETSLGRDLTTNTGSIGFAELYVRPVAVEPGSGSFLNVDNSVVFFEKVGSVGFIEALDGDGVGGPGELVPLGPSAFALDGSDRAADWIRLTIRQDLANGLWDLSVNGQLAAINLGFYDAVSLPFLMQVWGDVVTDTYMDDFAYGDENPLGTDADADGILDSYEATYGLNTSVNDRDSDLDGDGLTNIEEFFFGTAANASDTDGDGASDFDEVLTFTNPLVDDGVVYLYESFNYTAADPAPQQVSTGYGFTGNIKPAWRDAFTAESVGFNTLPVTAGSYAKANYKYGKKLEMSWNTAFEDLIELNSTEQSTEFWVSLIAEVPTGALTEGRLTLEFDGWGDGYGIELVNTSGQNGLFIDIWQNTTDIVQSGRNLTADTTYLYLARIIVDETSGSKQVSLALWSFAESIDTVPTDATELGTPDAAINSYTLAHDFGFNNLILNYYTPGINDDTLPVWLIDELRVGETYETVLPGLINGTGNNDPEPNPDTDADGLSDDWENQYFGNLDQAGTDDFDNDGLSNAKEYAYGTDPSVADTLGEGGITRELYSGIPGYTVADLTNAEKYPASPDLQETRTLFEAPAWTTDDNYGQRMRGFLTAPVTGDYTFWISSDDQSELWLSTDDNPVNKVKIAGHTGWTGSREFDKYPEQQSVSIPLVAGQRYYIEALHKEGVYGDHLAVAWAFPGQQQEVIPGLFLSPAPLPVTLSGFATREIWNGIGGNTLTDLALSAAYPDAPTATGIVTSLSIPTSRTTDDATRVSGYVIAPETGDYAFKLSAANSAQFSLSTDSDDSDFEEVLSITPVAGQSPVASETTSGTISLTAGSRYYFELVSVETLATDTVSVSWTTPSNATYAVIGGTDLAPPMSHSRDIKEEIWTGISGSTVAALTGSAEFSGDADIVQYIPSSAAPSTDNLDSYGTRISGLLFPQETGTYLFHVASDDQSELHVSTDNSPANLSLVASVTGYTGYAEWDKYAEQTSSAITLEAGKAYYFEVLHKEGILGDHVEFAWTTPGAAEPSLIGGKFLGAYVSNDGDMDGIEDDWETQHRLNSVVTEDALYDFDDDGLNNLAEYRLGTDPFVADTDGDGASDRDEALAQTDALSALSAPDATLGDWQIATIGSLPGSPRILKVGNELILAAEGRGLPDSFSEQLQTAFAYQEIEGDFDIIARIDGYGNDLSQFGLMATDSLNETTRFAGVNMKGNLVQRLEESGLTDYYAGIVSNTHQWIRLTRRGTVFESATSVDGEQWVVTGNVSMPVAEILKVGVFGSSVVESIPVSVYDVEIIGDTDGDGLTDSQEASLGTNPNLADTDGDGLNDWLEVNVSHTNPLVADNGTVVDLQTVVGAGFDTGSDFGSWFKQDDVVYARGQRGDLDYTLTVPTAGFYRLAITGQQRNPYSVRDRFTLVVSVDDVFAGRSILVGPHGTPGTTYVYLPWLDAGSYTFNVKWVNGERNTYLQIDSVALQAVGGDDNDSNGKPDWLDTRLANITGLDETLALSKVSPFCLEGKALYLDSLAIASSYNPNDPDPADPILPTRALAGYYYTNIALNPLADTIVDVSDQGANVAYQKTITWETTNILDDTDMVIRAGDSLMLAAFDGTTQPTDPVTIEIFVDGETTSTATYTVTASDDVPHTFAAGDWQVKATVTKTSETVIEDILLEARSVDLGTPGHVLTGHDKVWTPSALPDGTALENDPNLIIEGEAPPFTLKAQSDQDATIIARVFMDGPIADSVLVDCIEDYTNLIATNQEISWFADGSRLYKVGIELSEVPDDIVVIVDIFRAGSTFLDGTVYKTFTASDFNEQGVLEIFLLIEGSVPGAPCHNIVIE